MELPRNTFCGRTRRELLTQAAGGFASLALAGMLDRDGFLGRAALGDDVRGPAGDLGRGAHLSQFHHAPKATSVIFLFMYGGPSHVDTFDYKPELFELDGKTVPVKTKGRGGERNEGRIVGPKWKFQQHGESGQWVSELFPHLATCVDELCFFKSMYAESPVHGSAMLMMNSGRILSGSPSLGSWVNYGLGSVSDNLPGYVVMLDPTGGPISGAKNWSSGYMPANYQGVVVKAEGPPIHDLRPPAGMTRPMQRTLLDFLNDENHAHLATRRDSRELAARVASYELAYRMQESAPEAVDLAQESEETLRMYGVDQPRTRDFGRRCLLARRLVERGVRFIQLYSGGNHNDANWDAHGDLVKNHNYHAGNTDQPIAALIQDLKQRGMLDRTLIVWGGEFGRQPVAEYAEGTGRDHNSAGFTMWAAGGGIKGGQAIGGTDDLGSAAVAQKMHVKRLHATLLHLLGVDPNRLSYFYGGLDQKLVGVEHVEPIREALA